jgi:hypothetical protein
VVPKNKKEFQATKTMGWKKRKEKDFVSIFPANYCLGAFAARELGSGEEAQEHDRFSYFLPWRILPSSCVGGKRE